MPRRPPSRRKIGVLVAALILSAAAALSLRGPAATRSRREASPLPPPPSGALLARLRAILPTLVLDRAEARALDFDIQSNTFDNQYPPDLSATFRWPLPGQTPNSPMMTEFFAGGFVLGKAENLQGHSRPGNVVVVVWAFNRPEGAFRSLRALRDLSGLDSAPSTFAPGAVLLSLPGTGVSDLVWVRGRALVRATAGLRQGGASMLQARAKVARAIDAKIKAEPFIGGFAPAPVKRPGPLDVRGPAQLAAHPRQRPAGRPRHRVVARTGAARRPRSPARRCRRARARPQLHGARACAAAPRR